MNEDTKRYLLDKINKNLYIYDDDNHGLKYSLIKLYISFYRYLENYESIENNKDTNIYDHQKEEIGFQRIIYIDIEWTISILEKYIYDHFTVNNHKPEIRLVNLNKNKFTKECKFCGNINCTNCSLSSLKEVKNVKDLLLKICDKDLVDNNYLYYDIDQRKIIIPRMDLELELFYPKDIFIKTENIFFKTNSLKIEDNTKFKVKGDLENITIYDCLKNFSKEEILDNENDWLCSTCNSFQKCVKRIQINYFPKILIIQLKRFKNEGNVKIENFVDIPINDFILNNDIFLEHFELVGIINHFGSTDFGHYIAICKNYYDKKWYKYDDAYVYEIDEKKIITKHAYILFYKNKDFDFPQPDRYYDMVYKNIEDIRKKFQNQNKKKADDT
ncbi:MAG: hypothetical protein MJ252_13380 [archaeon]|nr:hypothetical protein [archaeon]